MNKNLKEKAKEFWNKLTAIVESKCNNFETLKPILKEIKESFGYETNIGYKASMILLSKEDFSMVDVDNLRYLIHEYIDYNLSLYTEDKGE